MFHGKSNILDRQIVWPGLLENFRKLIQTQIKERVGNIWKREWSKMRNMPKKIFIDQNWECALQA